MSRCLRLIRLSLVSVLVAVWLAQTGGAIATATTSWPQVGRTVKHHNAAVNESAFTTASVSRLGIAWRARFGHFASGQGGAAASSGVAYIGGSTGVVSAFSLRRCAAGHCTRLWRGVTHGGIFGTPAISRGLVLVGSSDHFLYAFAAGGCGSAVCPPVWRGRLLDAALSSVAATRQAAYLGDFGGRLYAFPLPGCGGPVCNPSWVGRGEPNLELNTAPAVGHGHVFIGALFNTPDDASGRLLAFRADGCGSARCRPEWTADMLGQVDGTLSPVVAGATVFMGSGTRFSEVPNGRTHLFAFAADGCGHPVCQPLRSYDTGDADVTGGIALARGVLYAGSQSTPDPNTIGVVTAFRASGCGKPVCEPLWFGVNFASGFESPPVVSGDVVFVVKGPASGFPVDEAVLTYPARGCGTRVCLPLSFTQLGMQQFYLGSPIAIAAHVVLVPTEASVGGADDLVALEVGPAARMRE